MPKKHSKSTRRQFLQTGAKAGALAYFITNPAISFGTSRISNKFAVSNGLTYLPLAESCREITDWWYSDVVSEERRQKMLAGPESLMTREKDILEAWKARAFSDDN